MTGRRYFLQSTISAAAGFAGLGLAGAEPSAKIRRPRPPYRVWFQPRCFHRDMDLYRNMTIDASGWLDPKLCALTGRAGLRWVYGTNHPDAEGEEYWVEECSTKSRTSGEFVSPGVAIDEWIPPKRPEVEDFLSKGLREARKRDPDVFIAVWFTDLRPPLTDLVKDGTVDLAIVQGYTHTAPRYGEGAWLAWPTCLRRCEAAKDAGILDKTIFSFGHITAEKNAKGEFLNTKWLGERAEEIKVRYPAMPGVAFFQSDEDDSPELRQLVRDYDRFSGELWPS